VPGARPHAARRRLALMGVALVIAATAGGFAAWWLLGRGEPEGRDPGVAGGAALAPPASEAAIRRFCSQHHVVPPPEALPRSVWKTEIDRMYPIGAFPPEGGIGVPPLHAVLAFYEARAPERLDAPQGRAGSGSGPSRFARRTIAPSGIDPAAPAVSDVRIVRLEDPARPDLLVCDARAGKVLLVRHRLPGAPATVLASIPNPARATPADLDRDGVTDLLVADLGSFDAYDHEKGRAVWLRGSRDGTFAAMTLHDGVGRVTDVEAGDLDGDGDLDLAIAVFGWRAAGEVVYLQNRTRDWARPAFSPVSLDKRPGAVLVPIGDLDGDGRPDIVSLLSQKDETLQAFLGRGKEPFAVEVAWQAPHPVWGASDISLADLDGDGDLDILLSNGDTIDNGLLVPWHGIRWLENRGAFPFEEKRFEVFAGCARARAADIDGDGDIDIAACSFLPFQDEAERRSRGFESVLWLERTGPAEFERREIEAFRNDHVSMDVGDEDGDGDPDIVLGRFVLDPDRPGTPDVPIVIFENLGASSPGGH
jgi:hypothetical protein